LNYLFWSDHNTANIFFIYCIMLSATTNSVFFLKFWKDLPWIIQDPYNFTCKGAFEYALLYNVWKFTTEQRYLKFSFQMLHTFHDLLVFSLFFIFGCTAPLAFFIQTKQNKWLVNYLEMVQLKINSSNSTNNSTCFLE